jgi:DeoR family transcriptional regulator, glycerol-3-phosphate regulon repressor
MEVTMFANERLNQIIEILNIDGKLIVKDLSLKFNVTEDCIRKDLKNLENKNLLERTYGGAMPVRKSAHNENIQRRKSVNMESKEIIATKAFNLVEDNETIFMDISTTNIMLAKLLANSAKRLTVVTNMMDIISAFSDNNIINVICTGGVFSNQLDGFTGSATIESIQKYKVNRAFIGSCGVNIFDKSITTFDVEDGNTKKAIINAGKNVYLLMNNSKFYSDGIYKFASLYDINSIITESKPTEDICEILAKTDTEIL